MRPNVSFYVFYLLLLGLGAACVTCVCYWITQWRGGFAWDGTHQQFNWHPALMVTGLVVFYGYGEHFLLCCGFRVWESNNERKVSEQSWRYQATKVGVIYWAQTSWYKCRDKCFCYLF